MRVIEKNVKEMKTSQFGMKTILIWQSSKKHTRFIEYTAVRKMPNGKVYRVDKAIYSRVIYNYYTPKK